MNISVIDIELIEQYANRVLYSSWINKIIDACLATSEAVVPPLISETARYSAKLMYVLESFPLELKRNQLAGFILTFWKSYSLIHHSRGYMRLLPVLAKRYVYKDLSRRDLVSHNHLRQGQSFTDLFRLSFEIKYVIRVIFRRLAVCWATHERIAEHRTRCGNINIAFVLHNRL